MRITRAHATLTVLAGAAVTALAACSSSAATATPRASASRATTPVAASASASPSPPAQLALAAYTAMWGDVQVLSESSDYTNPRLGDHLAGSAYMTISENMSVNKANGIVGVGAPVLHPRVLSANATTVTLADCMDDRNWLEAYAATHKLVDTVPGGRRYTTATVTQDNGVWKVTAIDTRGDGSCT
jgi:hypothetical protein